MHEFLKESSIEELEHFLEKTEQKYGGLVRNVTRSVISPFEGRYYNIHQGGDRMKSQFHNYSKMYAKYLLPIVKKDNLVVVEIGILTGIGLAIWCDLFVNCKIIGFDIDPTIFKNNLQNLKHLQAFSKSEPEVYSFDQYADNKDLLLKIFNTSKIDVIIDDGCHKSDAIINTFTSFLPYLSNDFVYIIEDNKEVHKHFKNKYKYAVEYENQLTVIKGMN